MLSYVYYRNELRRAETIPMSFADTVAFIRFVHPRSLIWGHFLSVLRSGCVGVQADLKLH